MKKNKLKSGFRHFMAVCMVVFTSATRVSAVHADDTPLFEEQFDTQEAFGRWTVINVDETSTTTWTYHTGNGNGIARILKDMSTPEKPQDDWLISPAIRMEAGKTYRLSCYVRSGVYNTKENLRVTLGEKAAADGQTKELLDINGLTREDSRMFTVNFNAEVSGAHHIGFHAYSDAGQGRIELDSITVTEVAARTAPAPVTALSATAGAEGALEADLTFVTPARQSDGSPLKSLEAIDIYRSEDKVVTIENPQRGVTLRHTDRSAAQGINTYRVVARNGSGESEAAEISLYVGKDVPAAVGGLTARRTASGTIRIKWDAPTSSVNGGYFNPDDVIYTVKRGEETVAAVESTWYDYAVQGDGQDIYRFAVVPGVDFGHGAEAQSNRVIAGNAIRGAGEETFAGGGYGNGPWCQDDTAADFHWEISADEGYGGGSGMLACNAGYASNGEESRLISPVFDMSQMTNPVLSFYMYRLKEDDPDIYGHTTDSLTVQVSVDGGDWTDLNEARFSIFGESEGWTKCEIPLTRYEGKTVSFGLLALLGNGNAAHRDFHVDNISISESGYTNDLAVRSFRADRRRVSVGQDTEFAAEVLNRGAQTASGYKVLLMRDGRKYAEEEGTGLKPTECRMHTFTVPSAVSDTGHESFGRSMAIEYDADEVEENNVTGTIRWSVRNNDVPAPQNLKASSAGEGTVLSWDRCPSAEPVTNSDVITVTDDFESYEPFIIEDIGGWTVLDLDKGNTLASSVIPAEYPHKGEPMAWQVFNTAEAGVITEDYYDNVFLPHSGKQYLMCASNDDYCLKNDDWLISPLLDGRGQTISFYARTPNSASGADWLEVCYSTTDRHPDSFTLLGGDRTAVWDYWNKDAYAFTLPEGARYFAIRCIRSFLYCMIDDVTYNACNGTKPGYEIMGYNVYRDGEKINGSLVTDNCYTDMTPVSTVASYTVTAVYDKGESGFSDEARPQASGIRGAAGKTKAAAAGYYDVSGKARSTAEKGINIVRMNDGSIRKFIRK